MKQSEKTDNLNRNFIKAELSYFCLCVISLISAVYTEDIGNLSKLLLSNNLLIALNFFGIIWNYFGGNFRQLSSKVKIIISCVVATQIGIIIFLMSRSGLRSSMISITVSMLILLALVGIVLIAVKFYPGSRKVISKKSK